MKKAFIFILVFFMLFSSGCTHEKYRRISFDGEIDLPEPPIGKNTVIEFSSDIDYGNSFSLYEINEHIITRDDIEYLTKLFDISVEPVTLGSGALVYTQNITPNERKILTFNKNSFSYSLSRTSGEFRLTDEELEKNAWDVLGMLRLDADDYEYAGVLSYSTLSSGENKFITDKTVTFVRKLGGLRVIGDDRLNITFGSNGLSSINLTLFDYRKKGNLDMLTLKQAAEKLDAPDIYGINADEDGYFEGKADVYTVEKTRLVFQNMFSQGCTILQPVYYFEGKAKSKNGEYKYNAAVVAIPEKYTYDRYSE